jgi:16S rRNA (guanine527-N7)-methyltransferase
MLVLKGQDFGREIEQAAKSWAFDVIDYPSATDPGGRVLAIRHPRPKVRP